MPGAAQATGTVPVDLGDGVQRNLKFTLRAAKDLEARTGKKLSDLQGDLDIDILALLLHLGLRWESPNLTEDQILDAVNMQQLGAIGTALQQAFGVASPAPNPAPALAPATPTVLTTTG